MLNESFVLPSIRIVRCNNRFKKNGYRHFRRVKKKKKEKITSGQIVDADEILPVVTPSIGTDLLNVLP